MNKNLIQNKCFLFDLFSYMSIFGSLIIMLVLIIPSLFFQIAATIVFFIPIPFLALNFLKKENFKIKSLEKNNNSVNLINTKIDLITIDDLYNKFQHNNFTISAKQILKIKDLINDNPKIINSKLCINKLSILNKLSNISLLNNSIDSDIFLLLKEIEDGLINILQEDKNKSLSQIKVLSLINKK